MLTFEQKRLKEFLLLGKERGFLTYNEVIEHLPNDTDWDKEQLKGIIGMINDMGIKVNDD